MKKDTTNITTGSIADFQALVERATGKLKNEDIAVVTVKEQLLQESEFGVRSATTSDFANEIKELFGNIASSDIAVVRVADMEEPVIAKDASQKVATGQKIRIK